MSHLNKDCPCLLSGFAGVRSKIWDTGMYKYSEKYTQMLKLTLKLRMHESSAQQVSKSCLKLQMTAEVFMLPFK